MSAKGYAWRVWCRLPPTQRRLVFRLLAMGSSLKVAPGTPSQRLSFVLSLLARENILADGGHQAVRRLTTQLAQSTSARRVIEVGSIPAQPHVSIVIPIYGKLDLLGPQIALLADDEEIRNAEIILVLDSPELEGEFVSLVHDLHALYGLALRALVLNQNAGYGIANNVAASHATGSLLLLLNSDVFPESAGWLGQMTAAYRARAKVGALAPKLLYEDRALQHAGMYFEHEPGRGWSNQHFFKGFPSTFASANVSREVPAVTGACLLIDRDLFVRAGGFDPVYAIGEYEDSDLCLRLSSMGYPSWYLAEVALFHLERRSFAPHRSRQRAGATRHNSWLHNNRWKAEMERLMELHAQKESGALATPTPSPAGDLPTPVETAP